MPFLTQVSFIDRNSSLKLISVLTFEVSFIESSVDGDGYRGFRSTMVGFFCCASKEETF